MTIVQQALQYIPLNKLVASSRNVRRKDRKADIDALAASIAARGLLQNLCVVPAEDDRYEVDAGGRRLAALKLLVKTRIIPKDWPVPCNVVVREAGREVSLIENVHRLAMDVMDEVDAFAALIVDGATPDEVAHRFGVTRRHVDQRLALSGLSPKIKAAWKRGDVNLEAAKAFCLVDDHAQQDAVFRSLGKPVTHAALVRARLMDGRVRASDRLAKFVGLEAYEAASGKLVRDLFDADAVFIDDPGLLAKLAEDKLDAARAPWLADGWSWVDINTGHGRGEGLASVRLHPDWRDPTADEQRELDRIGAEIEALDAQLEADGIGDDPRWSQKDDLEAAYETIRQAGRRWTADQRALGGVYLAVGYDGDLVVTEGLVRLEDQKRVEAYLRQRRGEAGETSGGDGDESTPEAAHRVSVLPKSVNRDLTLQRTRAIRLLLSRDPDTALALCVSAIAHRMLQRADLTGVAISGQLRSVDDLPALDDIRSELEGRLPEDEIALFDWALDQSRERLLALLAVLTASAVDLTHEDTSAADLHKQALADRLAQQLELDMNAFWTADLAFWMRLPKAALMTAYAQSPAMAERGARTRDDLLKAHAKLRKDDLAGRVSAIYSGGRYLPEILFTPTGTGEFAVTAEGLAVIAGTAVAAE